MLFAVWLLRVAVDVIVVGAGVVDDDIVYGVVVDVVVVCVALVGLLVLFAYVVADACGVFASGLMLCVLVLWLPLFVLVLWLWLWLWILLLCGVVNVVAVVC